MNTLLPSKGYPKVFLEFDFKLSVAFLFGVQYTLCQSVFCRITMQFHCFKTC